MKVEGDTSTGVRGWPLMMSEVQAATYLSLSVSDLRKCVRSGEIPAPHPLGPRLLWNRRQIERHLDMAMDPASREADDLTQALDRWSQS